MTCDREHRCAIDESEIKTLLIKVKVCVCIIESSEP